MAVLDDAVMENRAKRVLAKLDTIARAAEVLHPGAAVTRTEVAQYLGSLPKEEQEAELSALWQGALKIIAKEGVL